MKKKLRILSCIVALCLLLSALCACNSAKKKAQRVVGTCAGYDVRYEELRYVVLTYKAKLETKYGEGIWDNPETAAQHIEELKSRVFDILRINYAVLALCSDFMTEDQMKDPVLYDAVDADISEEIDKYGSKKAFQNALKELYMTESFMRFCLWVNQCESELYYILTSDLGLIENDPNQFADWLEDGNGVYVRHMYVSNDEGESVDANRALAENLRQQLVDLRHDPEEFEKLITSSKNEDTQYLAPYYIVRDVYVRELESAAFSLGAVGDVSEVVETDDGFYILVRVEDTEEHFLSQVPSLLQSYQWAKLEDMVTQKKETISIELNDYGKELDLVKMK
ncbi:MAG: hypothetical protein E7637_01140 [Ruminococcaceae bacterium]|nr:hypothetical protein [Oscillospiraceae bacterium]